MKSLKDIEKATLIALFTAVKGALKAHVPFEAIAAKFDRSHIDKRGNKGIKKALKRLCALKYVNKHPTRGGATYELTLKGRDYILNLKKSMQKTFSKK